MDTSFQDLVSAGFQLGFVVVIIGWGATLLWNIAAKWLGW